MQERVWLILLNGKICGPYTIDELKKNAFITPETFAKKTFWSFWKKIKDIPELKEVFDEEELENEEQKAKYDSAEVILSRISVDPGHFLIWIIIVVIILIYTFYRLHD